MPPMIATFLTAFRVMILMENGEFELNPLIRRDWWRYIRGKRAFRSQFIFLMIMMLVTLFSVGTWLVQGMVWRNVAGMASSYFRGLAITVLLFLSFINAFRNITALPNEIEKKTIDALHLTPLTNFELLLGKLYGSMCHILILALLSLPFFAVVFFFGGISIGEILIWGLMILLIPLGTGFIGISLSTFTRTTRHANTLAFIFIFFALIAWPVFAIKWIIGAFWIFIMLIFALITLKNYKRHRIR